MQTACNKSRLRVKFLVRFSPNYCRCPDGGQLRFIHLFFRGFGGGGCVGGDSCRSRVSIFSLSFSLTRTAPPPMMTVVFNFCECKYELLHRLIIHSQRVSRGPFLNS